MATRAALSRLESAATQYGTVWDEDKVRDAMIRQYRLLNVPMPPVKFVGNLEEGFREVCTSTPSDAYMDAHALTHGRTQAAGYSEVQANTISVAFRTARAAVHAVIANTADFNAFWTLRYLPASSPRYTSPLRVTYSPANWAAVFSSSNILHIGRHLLDALEAGLGWYITFTECLVLVPMPLLRLDKTGSLHSDTALAVEWRDGAGYHFLHGVHFDTPLWKRVVSREMPLADILALKDIEQRTQALKYSDSEERE